MTQTTLFVGDAGDAPSVLPAGARGASDTARPTIVALDKIHLLGDALQRVPAFRALRFAFPNHRIVSVTRFDSTLATSLAPIRHLLVDEILTDQPIGSAAQLREVVQKIGSTDIVLDFRSNLRIFDSYRALAPLASRYISNGAGFFLRKGIPAGIELRGDAHSGRLHRLVELIAGRQLPFDPTIPVLPEAAAEAAKLLPEGRRYFGMTTNPLHIVKAWPRDNTIALAAFIEKLGLHPVFLLGSQEADQREWFAEKFPSATIIAPLPSRDPAFHLWLLHAVAGRLTGCVANESGLGHVFASQGIPLLTLAGPTNPYRWKPLTPFWWLRRAQEFGSDAMAAIPVEAVQDTVAEMVRWTERSDRNAFAA